MCCVFLDAGMLDMLVFFAIMLTSTCLTLVNSKGMKFAL
jgi:hypothetical protein